MSQTPGDQTPPQSPQGGSGSLPADPANGGSWPPMPPPLINRLVSSATATPFVPEERKPAISELSFSCVVEPPPKRVRRTGVPDEKPAPPARSVVPTVPSLPTPARMPAILPNPAIVATGVSPTRSVPPPAAMPMTTVPPFGGGATTPPFAPTTSAEDVAFEFNPEQPPKVRWLSWSTVILVAGCVAGYFQYQRMQEAGVPAMPAQPAVAAAEENPARPSESSGIATPFTALKQAKATIKDAGEKHRAAYDLVEQMLDDPSGATAPKPATAAVVARAAAPEPAVLPKRDAVTALLGSDGEFLVPIDSPKPTLRFARWVRAVKIGGARLSENPRVLVGAAAFTFGDVVDLDLGVVLDGYNAERRALRFRETATGAVIERRL